MSVSGENEDQIFMEVFKLISIYIDLHKIHKEKESR
jgi:hypothetical protein